MNLRVLIITSQWPDEEHPFAVPFLVREVQELQNRGIDIEVFSYKGGFNVINYFMAWRELRQKLSTASFDLWHCHFGVSALLALRPRRPPLIVTFHGSDLNGIYSSSGRLTLKGLLLRRTSQFVALYATEIVVVSESMKQYLPRKSCHVIPMGVDLETFEVISRESARHQLGLDANKRYVLFTGSRNNPIKRYSLAQMSIELLQNEVPNVELLLANQVPPEQMPLYYNSANVMLLTSTREGSPTAVKEALACNCSVVSTDVGDVRQWLTGVPGSKVTDSDDPASISEALKDALQITPSNEGRQRVTSVDIRRTSAKVIEVYRSMVNSKYELENSTT